jgi:outer membrane protein assembly factor BamB
MSSKIASRLVPVAFATLGVLLLVHWLAGAGSGFVAEKRIPLEDKSAAAAVVAVDLQGQLTKGDAAAMALGADWPGFRGPLRDNISAEAVRLSREFGNAGPPKLWQIELGAEGYAGVAVAEGRIYLMDYEAAGRADVLKCLSPADGREIWRHAYAIDIGRNHGITRTVPAVAAGHVVAMGPKCHVICLDAVSGEFKWGVDLAAQYRTTVPPWYAGQNVLIDGDRVILAPGGTALLLALDLKSGKIIWQTPNPRKWEMTHSSVASVMFKGRKLYLYCASAGVVGVSADDGAIVFELPEWKVSMANVPTPLPLPEDRVFLTGGYGAGSMMIQLVEAGGEISAKVLYRLPPEVFGAEQQTPVFHNGHIFGVIPVSAQLVCLSLDGKQVWASGAKNRYGLGPFMIADNMIIVLNDAGVMSLVEADASAFKPIAKATLLDHGHEAWGPLAISGGRLFARDMTRLAAFDLRKERP